MSKPEIIMYECEHSHCAGLFSEAHTHISPDGERLSYQKLVDVGQQPPDWPFSNHVHMTFGTTSHRVMGAYLRDRYGIGTNPEQKDGGT